MQKHAGPKLELWPTVESSGVDQVFEDLYQPNFWLALRRLYLHKFDTAVLTENAIRAGLASLRTTMSDSCLTGYSVRTGVTGEIR